MAGWQQARPRCASVGLPIADLEPAEADLQAPLQLGGGLRGGAVLLAPGGDEDHLGGGKVPNRVFDRLDQLDTPGAGRWFLRALCYDHLNQPKPALEAYQKFMELDQNKNPDQVWQAQERSKVLRRMLEGKK